MVKYIQYYNIDSNSSDPGLHLLYISLFLFYRYPNSDGAPDWPPYDDKEEQYVIIDTPITKGKHLKSGATKLINKIFQKGNPSMHEEL